MRRLQNEHVPLEHGFWIINHNRFGTACSFLHSLEILTSFIGNGVHITVSPVVVSQKVTGLLFKHTARFLISSQGRNIDIYRDSLCKRGLFRFQSQQKTPTSQLYHRVSQHGESRLAPVM